jgi:cellulose synthase/poly-beta-1,6-N-acetylglucosamine synthase-like glycosyltransferase
MVTVVQSWVVYGGIFLAISSIALFAAGDQLARTHWLASLVLIAELAVTAWTIQFALETAPPPLGLALIISVGAGGLVAVRFPDWNALGHAVFAAIGGSALAFLTYVVFAASIAHLRPWSLALTIVMLLLQVATLVLLVANVFEVIDVICRVRWKRRHSACRADGFTPKVSIHVPTHAEPPELVIETLNALARLDYENYEVLVIDNNTADETLWRPVEAHCRRLGDRFRFFHLLPWPGYKSGALNFALTQVADDTEIIAVVDADYVVERAFLADLVGHFFDTRVAFVQTPQDYRDHESRGRFGRALYLAYLYFFEISMTTRNEYNGIIYAGTMGLIRRSALEELGGWDEWCVTEDAEISLRLLDAGYESVYVPNTYGRGIMPLDFAGLKKQRFRWAFGGMQILRKHAGRLFNPWSQGKLSWSQRLAYLNGGLQWLNDPMALAFSAVLLAGAATLLAGQGLAGEPLAGMTILMPPLFILFAVLRFLWAFRLRAKCSLREAADALLILLGLTWVVALACFRGLVSKHGVFLRTPKQGNQPTILDAFRIVWCEMLLGGVCLAAAIALLLTEPAEGRATRTLVILMLLWQSLTYLSAVCGSLWSYLESRPSAFGIRIRKFPQTVE